MALASLQGRQKAATAMVLQEGPEILQAGNAAATFQTVCHVSIRNLQKRFTDLLPTSRVEEERDPSRRVHF
jgi:hypothetical protein